MEWESGQKQVEMKDKILQLVGASRDLQQRHWAAERESRAR